MRFQILFSIAFLSVARAEEPDPGSLPAIVHTVASAGLHRFIEYRVCSPEHCWSQSFLQWADISAMEKRTDRDDTDWKWIASTPVAEIGYGSAVESARWVWLGDTPRLEVRVGCSHETCETYTMLIEPGPPGKYKAHRE